MKSLRRWIFTSSILTIFDNFLDFFTLTSYKKGNDVSIRNIISAVFWLRIILDKLLRIKKSQQKIKQLIHFFL